jgi:protein-tyrosine-phosphatase
VLFVCWGNICRSPIAEAVMRRVVDEAGLATFVEVDSAGTSAEHAGEAPDRRAIAEADRRGLDLRPFRARKVRADDWERFDLLLVADGMRPTAATARSTWRCCTCSARPGRLWSARTTRPFPSPRAGATERPSGSWSPCSCTP